MSGVQTLIRAHAKGWTTAIFDPDGRRIFSAGTDGIIKNFNEINDTNPMEHVIGEKINCIVYRNETLVVATEGTCVHVIQVEDGLPEGMATRFTAEVMHVALNKDATKLAACSCDFSIKVVNFLSIEDREYKLEGHSAGVLSVAFDPLDLYLASASCDGTVRIWKLDDRKEVKRIKALSPCNDPKLALSLCRLCWDIHGEFLAVPIDKQICLYERNTWETLSYLSCPQISKPIAVCSVSSNGAYIAAGCDDGWIIVWRLENRQVVHRVRDSSHSAICSLAWHPQCSSTSVLYTNTNGSIGLIKSLIASDSTLDAAAINDLLGCDEDGDTSELLRVAAAQAESSRLIDEEEAQELLNVPVSDNDDSDSIDLTRIKADFLPIDDDVEDLKQPTDAQPNVPDDKYAPVITESAARAIAVRPPVQKPFQPGSMPKSFRERFMVWNRIGLVIQYRGGSDEAADADDDNATDFGSIEMEFHDTTLHHSLRLANRAGYTMADLSLTALMLASSGSDDPSLADDADNGEELDPADLSQIAVLPLDTNTPGGASDSASSEWTIKLPPGEGCQAICLVPSDDPVQRGYAVVATSKLQLRVFAQPAPAASLSRPATGLRLFQVTKLGLPPISLPGKGVVAMCSHPLQPIMGIVASTATGELVWRIYYLGGIALGDKRTQTPGWLSGVLSSWQSLPLSPSIDQSQEPSQSTRLSWFGFSDLGGLYTHDSTGSVRRLLHTRTSKTPEYHWAQVCNTRSLIKPSNRHSDHYFLVGIVESTDFALSAKTDATQQFTLGQLQAIYCKASKWPRVFPRPVLSALDFRLPLCSIGTDQADLEETYLRSMIGEDWPSWGPNLHSLSPEESETSEILSNLSDRCLIKRKGVLLRLFALAAKLESDWASLNVARLMPDAATVQLAIRYAGRLRRQHLAQKLGEIALEKERMLLQSDVEDEEETELDNVYDPQPDLTVPMNQTVARDAMRSPQPLKQSTAHHRARHSSGRSEDHDVTNVSLVSSATDDTHEETNLSGLPLPDTEDFSQSIAASCTPPVSTRNPFRDGPSASVGSTSGSHPTRGRGSEILDSWTPTTSASSSLKLAQSLKSKESRSVKKRQAPTSSAANRATKSKRAKPLQSDPVQRSIPKSPSPSEFLDWFEENRGELEEEYPEQSADELLRIARLRFREFCAMDTQDPMDPGKDKENLPKISSEQSPAVDSVNKRASHAEKTSSRLSSFRFQNSAQE